MRINICKLFLIMLCMILINVSLASAITITPRISKDNYQIFMFSILGYTDATLSVTTDKIAFTNMHLEVTEEFANTSMKFEALSEPEEGIGAPAGAYQHIKVVNSNIRDAEIKSLKIEFRIKKSWLEEKKASDSDIVLMRFNQKDRWMEFPAKRITESQDYLYYEAKVPGFGYLSYFSIAANKPVKPTITQNPNMAEITLQNTNYSSAINKTILSDIANKTKENKTIIQKISGMIRIIFGGK